MCRLLLPPTVGIPLSGQVGRPTLVDLCPKIVTYLNSYSILDAIRSFPREGCFMHEGCILIPERLVALERADTAASPTKAQMH
jgi:hypothetical protein